MNPRTPNKFNQTLTSPNTLITHYDKHGRGCASNPFVSAVGEGEAFVRVVLKPLGFMTGQNHNFLKVSAAFRKAPACYTNRS
jgi:hypothetical protein